MYKSVEPPPLSKIFKFFDPKFLRDFEGIVKYFSARNFGLQYVQPQGTFVGSHFGPEMAILGKSRRNLGVCHLGAPQPNVFDLPKVLTLGYIQHKYISVTKKTLGDTCI